jgi:superfamily II DNA or RNA helicase
VRVTIVSPIKALIQDASQEEIENLKKELTYTNTSVKYQLNKHYKSDWLKRNKPEEWAETLTKLQSKLKRTLIYNDGDGYYVRPGSLPSLGIDNFENKVKMPSFKPMAWYKKPEYDPYEYQERTADLMIETMLSGLPSAAQLATGLGKSYILALITKKVGVRTLIVTPSTAIFTELYEFFTNCFGKNKVGALGDGKKKTDKQIVIAIAKSIVMLKPGSKDYENIRSMQLVLGDESHTLPAETLDTAFHGVLSEVPMRGFLSGTQTRGDGSVPLLNSIIGKVVIDRDLAWGIENGYLSKLDFTMVNIPSSMPTYWNGDPMKMKRVHLLYNQNIINFVAKTANTVAKVLNQSTLILVEEIEQISLIAKLLEVPYTYVHGNTIDKAELTKYKLENRDLTEEIEKFNSGEVKVFIGTKCVSTGTNFYPTHFTMNLQGGASEIGTKQGVLGRSTRLLEKSRYKNLHAPKNVSKIFDFNVDNESLKGHFFKRYEYYKEARCPIKWIDVK